MYARVTQFQADPARADEASRIVDHEIIPGLREEPGFERMYALVDMQTGQGMVVTIWESPAAEEASRPRVGERFARLGPILTGPPQPGQTFTVVNQG